MAAAVLTLLAGLTDVGVSATEWFAHIRSQPAESAQCPDLSDALDSDDEVGDPPPSTLESPPLILLPLIQRQRVIHPPTLTIAA